MTELVCVRQEWLVHESGTWSMNTQGCLLLPCLFACCKLQMCGIIGMKFLFESLGNMGREDTALAVLEKTDYPSLGFMAFNTFEKVMISHIRAPSACWHVGHTERSTDAAPYLGQPRTCIGLHWQWPLLTRFVQQHLTGGIGYEHVRCPYFSLSMPTCDVFPPDLCLLLHYQLPKATENLWELWDGYHEGVGMNSRNHHMFSSFSTFLVQLAGLEQAKTSFGHSKLLLRPSKTVGLSSASVESDFDHGKVHLEWERSGGLQSLKLPENTSKQLSCGSAGSGGVVKAIRFASWGTLLSSFGVGVVLCT